MPKILAIGLCVKKKRGTLGRVVSQDETSAQGVKVDIPSLSWREPSCECARSDAV